jgi:acetyl-CoA carboxylase biotin carboxyl carrier protein
MAETKAPSGRKSGMTVDTKLVRQLADVLAETGLTALEVEEGGRRIRVARHAAPAPAAQFAAPPAAHSAAPPAPAPTAEAAAVSTPGEAAGAIRSPMVGTVYLAPEPGADAFVKVGDQVAAGDTLLVVEAMKVKNPITATSAGKVQAVLVENGQPVEYDQPLILVA